jgi:hypothetical protein
MIEVGIGGRSSQELGLWRTCILFEILVYIFERLGDIGRV